MEKKYELTNEKILIGKKTLYRIKALRDFSNVKKGDLGGFIESEKNLSHEGDCWIYDDAKVYASAKVSENATIHGRAKIHGYTKVFNYAKVYDNAEVYGKSMIFDHAKVYNNALIFDHASISGCAKVYDGAILTHNAVVRGRARIVGQTRIFHDGYIESNDDYISITRPNDYNSLLLNSISDTSTFYLTIDKNISVVSSLNDVVFYPTLNSFRDKLNELKRNTHNTNDPRQIDEYLILADSIEKIFNNRLKSR